MKQWMALILVLSAWICQASENLSQPPLLTFEITYKPDSEFHHVLTHAMREIMQKQGYQFQAISLPPRRGLQELKAARVDGSVGRIGNIAKLLKAMDMIRVDVPIAVFQISRWCRKDLPRTQHPIKVGMQLGNMIPLLLKDHLDLNRIQLVEVASRKGFIRMLQTARLDCILASEIFLETEGINTKDLQAFDRFDFISFKAYPWIEKRHAALKTRLEDGLRHYPFSNSFRKKYLNQKPACEGKMDILCPDGLLVKNKADLS